MIVVSLSSGNRYRTVGVRALGTSLWESVVYSNKDREDGKSIGTIIPMEAMDSVQSIGMQIHTITNITSYDVLVDPPVEGVVGEYQLDNYSKNVGNNRLKVFLTLYKQNYDRALRQNNVTGCESIVKDILHTLNTKCVPTGRLLINAVPNMNTDGRQLAQMCRAVSSPAWNLMGEHQSRQLIHGILFGVPPPFAYIYRQQQMREHQAVGQSDSSNNKQPDEHKRRRRSSLLRRSASDSLLNDLKKVSRFDQQQEQQEELLQNRRMSKEEPIWSSCRRLTENGALSLNRMDVILTSNREALDPNCQSIGNNRLHILVAMQSGKYQVANDRQKDAILDEVIQTVHSFWKGRFLTESLGGSYDVLDNADAKRSLRNIFDMRSGQNLFSQDSSPAIRTQANTMLSDFNKDFNKISQLVGSGSGIHELGKTNVGVSNISNNINNGNHFRNQTMNVARHASTSALPCGNTGMISNDTKNILSRQMSSSLIPNHMSSMILPRVEPPVAVSGIDDLRSAAIKSLQKQKARQQVANRLEKVAMRTSQQQLLQLQLQPQLQQLSNMKNVDWANNNNSVNNDLSSLSIGGGAKRRQSSIFGTLDPSVMDEIVSGCFDDEDE